MRPMSATIIEKRMVNSSAASSAPARSSTAPTRNRIPSATLGRDSTSPFFQASQKATGVSRSPWPAAGLVHQSRASSAAGCRNRMTNAMPASSSGRNNSRLGPGSTRVGASVAVIRSARAPAKEHDRNGPGHDPDIGPEPLPGDVLEVVSHLLLYIVQIGIVLEIDLGVAGDAGPDALPYLVVRDLHPKVRNDCGPLRARAHHVHLAPQHVDQLRQLVEAELAQPAAQSRDPAVVLAGPDRPGTALGVQRHGPEFIDPEGAAADVLPAPGIVGAVAGGPLIQPDPGLGVDDRASRGQLDGDGNEDPEWQCQDDAEQRHHDVEHAARPLGNREKGRGALPDEVQMAALRGGPRTSSRSLDRHSHRVACRASILRIYG